MYEIIESGPTETGKWQVRVVIDPNTTAFFGFKTEPTQAQVDIEAEAWALNRRLSELQAARAALADTE